MAERIKGYAGKVVFGLMAGIGFNLCQRLMDHFVDQVVGAYAWLGWLA